MFSISCQWFTGASILWRALGLWIPLGCASIAAGQTVLDLPAQPSAEVLDITERTPLGRVRPGGDISAPLQWALDNLHFHKRPLFLPAGEWKLSKTIRTPFKSGLTLLGSGTGDEIDDAKPGTARFVGARTLIRWAGEPGGTMFEIIGRDVTIGNFTLQGDASKLSKGILINMPNKGIGTSCIRFRDLAVYDCDTAVQCGSSLGTPGCDNIHFDWLRVGRCKVGYHGINAMGMNVVFDRFAMGGTSVGILMDGGGDLHVRSGTVMAGTLLKINNTKGLGVGKYNGSFRLSNTKVDAQAGNSFCLVDCAEPYPIRFLADGGLYSNDQAQGTFARLTGRNHLEIRDWTATFRTIEGAKEGAYIPTVMLRGSRLWRPVEEIFTGEINARVRDCVNTRSEWVDWDSKPMK